MKKLSPIIMILAVIGLLCSACSTGQQENTNTNNQSLEETNQLNNQNNENASEHHKDQNQENNDKNHHENNDTNHSDHNSNKQQNHKANSNEHKNQNDEKENSDRSGNDSNQDKKDKQDNDKDGDKPLLKDTVKTTDDGEKVITNPKSLLACANKERNLPSDYEPKNLVVPDVSFPYNNPKSVDKSYVRKAAAEPMENLFQAAEKDGIDLFAISGYRSYDTQKSVFQSNVEQKGSKKKANQVSAKPGQSEHQTGLTMDVSTQKMGFALKQDLGDTKAGKWLVKHAATYGFIIRYPKGEENITGYEYEPWHIRYVGKKPAKKIMKQQITLEEYLGYEKES